MRGQNEITIFDNVNHLLDIIDSSKIKLEIYNLILKEIFFFNLRSFDHFFLNLKLCKFNNELNFVLCTSFKSLKRRSKNRIKNSAM